MRRAVVVLIVLLLPSAVLSAHWPAWRGPSDSGVSLEKNLPVTWSDRENVAWEAPLRGMGVSTPLVWADRVIVTSQEGASRERDGRHPTLVTGADAASAGERTLGGRQAGVRVTPTDRIRFVVTALDRETGRKVWEYALDPAGDLPEVHEKHNLASPSPVTDGQRIYTWFGTGQVVALDLSGKMVWQRNLAREYAPVTIIWGPGSSPALYGDTLYLLNYHGQSAYLLAVDAKTGTTKWKADGTPGVTSYSTPVLVKGPKGQELVVNSSEGVTGHDPATGARLWHFAEANSFPVPAAVPHGDIVYLNRGHRSSPYMAIRLGGRGEIANTHVVWRQPTGGPYVPSIIHYDGLIYMATDQGIISAVDAASGERVWQARIPGVYMASPVAGDGKVYFAGETGETLVLEAGRQLKILARNKLTGRFGGSPAIAAGRIFLRADDRLVAVGR